MPYQILKSEVVFHIFVFLKGLKIKYYKLLKLGWRSEEALEDEIELGRPSIKGLLFRLSMFHCMVIKALFKLSLVIDKILYLVHKSLQCAVKCVSV